MTSLPPQRRQPIDPEVGVPDLIRRLTDDSKRLVSDEVRLAKLELGENIHSGARGMLWMSLAFGVGVVMLVAVTVFLSALLGRLTGNYWAGTLITGVLELALAAFLIKKGVTSFSKPSYTLSETRTEAKATVKWAAAQRAD